MKKPIRKRDGRTVQARRVRDLRKALLTTAKDPSSPLAVAAAQFAAEVRARSEALIGNPNQRLSPSSINALAQAVDLAERRVSQL